MPKTHAQERADDKAIANVGGAGEVNTASNQGGGTSIVKGKAGVDLQFNAIKSENALITIALDGVTNDVELTMDETAVDHDNITNAADGSHVHIGTSAPTEVAGLWIDTTGGAGAYKLKAYNGTAWVEFMEF